MSEKYHFIEGVAEGVTYRAVSKGYGESSSMICTTAFTFRMTDASYPVIMSISIPLQNGDNVRLGFDRKGFNGGTDEVFERSIKGILNSKELKPSLIERLQDGVVAFSAENQYASLILGY